MLLPQTVQGAKVYVVDRVLWNNAHPGKSSNETQKRGTSVTKEHIAVASCIFAKVPQQDLTSSSHYSRFDMTDADNKCKTSKVQKTRGPGVKA